MSNSKISLIIRLLNATGQKDHKELNPVNGLDEKTAAKFQKEIGMTFDRITKYDLTDIKNVRKTLLALYRNVFGDSDICSPYIKKRNRKEYGDSVKFIKNEKLILSIVGSFFE